jgi:hypothetical protein
MRKMMEYWIIGDVLHGTENYHDLRKKPIEERKKY